MGFKPQGMPSAFLRTSTPNTNQRKRIIDRLVTIDSYELGKQQINVVAEDGTHLMATVRPDAIARNIKRSQEQGGKNSVAKWEGYSIDSRMAENLKPGHKIVLERMEEVRSFQNNGKTVKSVLVDRVINVADVRPEKTFEGLFSISTYQNNVFHVQSWERKAVHIDDQQNIERIKQHLDEGSQAYLNKQLRPHWGVQFRVVQPLNNEKNECLVIDTSPPFEWVPRKTDESGAEIEPGHPLDGAKFIELLLDAREGYLGYVSQKFPEAQYPGRFIEVCPYINYRAGPKSRYMAIPERQFDPLYKLAHTQTKLAIDDDTFVQGKNLAVLGVLQLSADQADHASRTYIPRNIAVRLHASGPMGHVHAWVRTFDDRKTTPHEALRNVLVNKATPGEKTSIPVQQPFAQAPEAGSVVSSTPGMDQQNAFDDWDDMDELFGEPPSLNADMAREKLAAARDGH